MVKRSFQQPFVVSYHRMILQKLGYLVLKILILSFYLSILKKSAFEYKQNDEDNVQMNMFLMKRMFKRTAFI